MSDPRAIKLAADVEEGLSTICDNLDEVTLAIDDLLAFPGCVPTEADIEAIVKPLRVARYFAKEVLHSRLGPLQMRLSPETHRPNDDAEARQ